MIRYLLLLLLPISLSAQTGIQRHGDHSSGFGVPTFTPSTQSWLTTVDSYTDKNTGKTYVYKGTVTKWVEDAAVFPRGTVTPMPTITVGSTTTLAAGLPATVTDSDPSANVKLEFGIPAGASGGGSGSGTWINPYLKIDLTRIEVAAYPTVTTVSGAGVLTSAYAGITISGSDNFNWANLQYAIYLNKTTGKTIYSHGNFVGLNKDIVWDWDHYILNWNGQGSTKLSTYTTAPITVLNRQDATATTWQQMISYTKFCNIQGIEFVLQSGQTGMDTQMQNNGTFFNLHFMGGNIGINGNFWINTTCNTINLGEIKTGIKLDAAEYTGAGTTATGNVKNSFLNIHYANATGLGEYVLWLRACESTNIDGIIGEGGHQKMGIYIDGANNLNFRLWMIHNLYGEDCHTNQAPCNGPNEAMIVVRNVISGLVSIDGLKGIYPQMLTNVQATGRLSVIISKLPWFENLGNRLFYTDPTSFEVRYQFYSVQSDYLPIPLSSAFTGKTMTAWWKTSASQDQPANTFVVY